MSELRELAHHLDPVAWVRDVVKIEPMSWQQQFLRAPRGASIIALTARQVGKTTTAGCAIAHTVLFKPRSLSVIACPAQRQSAEAVRHVRDNLNKAGAKLVSDNVYGLELDNGSRVLALPGSDDSIRGLTVDGWIVADEAARLTPELIAALRPMRARRPEARFAMLSTAWSRTDPFWQVWSGDDPSWIRLQATADQIDTFSADYLEAERRNLGEAAFKREYLGIPAADQASPFTWELYEAATDVPAPLMPAGPAFRPPPPAAVVSVPNPFRNLSA
jgi:Terminase large subunit, T4likevirus-type, N-terminal